MGAHLAQFFSSLSMGWDLLEILLNVDSGSVGLEWGLRFCISNKFSGDATAAVGSKDLQQPSYLTHEENEAQR